MSQTVIQLDRTNVAKIFKTVHSRV